MKISEKLVKNYGFYYDDNTNTYFKMTDPVNAMTKEVATGAARMLGIRTTGDGLKFILIGAYSAEEVADILKFIKELR